MAIVYIEKIQTISDLIRWKAKIDNHMAQILYLQSCVNSAMGMGYTNPSPADIQFRFDSKLAELTKELGQ